MNDNLSNDASDHEEKNMQTSQRTALYQTELEETERVCEAIVRAVTAVSDTAMTAMDPLYDVIDPDALDAVMTSFDADNGGYITFSYAGYEIVIQSDGQLTLCPDGELTR